MEEFLKVLYKISSFIGLIILLSTATLVVYDYVDMEKNLNFDRLDLTNRGIVKRGYLLDAHLNCTNGFLGLSILNFRFYYKPLSDKKKEMHGAKKACKTRGFTPEEGF